MLANSKYTIKGLTTFIRWSFLLSASFFLVEKSHGQVVEISIEPYAVHDGSITELSGMTTYHVYAVCTSASDFVSAVYGDAAAPLTLTSTDGFYQNALGSNLGWTINPAFFGAFPAIEYDSWITLGVMNQIEVTGQPNTVGMNDAFNAFEAGGDIILDHEQGGSWFTLYGDTQAEAGDDLKVLLAQLTVSNSAVITGLFNVSLFVNGDQSQMELFEGLPFSTDEAIFGCMDNDAVNYNPDATQSGEPCIYPCSLELFISEVTPITCPGVADGAFEIIASGDQLGVLFGIDGDNPTLAVGVFDDFPSGMFTVIAVDGAGCEASIEVELIEPDPIVISASMTESVSCNGGSDAVISGSSSGGTGAMSYSLSETFVESSADLNFTDLSPGLYTIYAMDENGCTAASGAIAVSNPPTLSVSVWGGQNGILDATCADSEDGTAILITIGGTGDFSEMQFSTDGENFAPGNTLNLGEGVYTFYAMDANGCIAETVNEYIVNAPEPIVISGTTTATSCIGAADGSITFSGEGGVGELSLSFNGSEYEYGDVFSYDGLSAGSFGVFAQDWNGCIGETVFTVSDGEEPCFVDGCTYPLADNYDAEATSDNGSCIFGAAFYEQFILGQNAEASEQANDLSDGHFCGDGTVWLGHLQKCVAVPLCFADLDLDGNRGTEDLLQLLSTYGTLCPEIPGCTDTSALNYVPYATQDDGSCVLNGLLGCTDSAACNFDPFANVDDGSCLELVFGYDCDGNCVGIDANENGICDADEIILGCTDESACNFDDVAEEDDGSCLVLDECGICGGSGIPLSACDCAGSLPEAGYDCDGNCLSDVDGDGNCDDIYGCIFDFACNYNPLAFVDDGSCVFFCPGCTDEAACNYDAGAIQEDGSCVYPLDLYGIEYVDCAGECLSDEDGDGVCFEDEIYGCTDAGSCNYDFEATEDDDSCEYDSCAGCLIEEACNYSPSSTIEDNSACEFESCAGCMYEFACNYDPSATIAANETCEFGTCPGCTDSEACNYNPTIVDDDGSCEYPVEGYDCEGACIIDSDLDGICDEFEVLGCMDPASTNWNENATDCDGSCEYEPIDSSDPEVFVSVEPFVTHTSGDLAGKTTYRLFANCSENITAITMFYGSSEAPLMIEVFGSGEGFYQHPAGSWTPEALTEFAIGFFPDVIYDSYVTLNLEGPAQGIELNPTALPGSWTSDFAEGNNIMINDLFGSGWFVTPDAYNTNVDEDGRVFFAQLTVNSSDILGGTINCQIQLDDGSAVDSSSLIEGVSFSNHEFKTYGCDDPQAENYNGCDIGSNCEYDCEAMTMNTEFTFEQDDCDEQLSSEVTISIIDPDNFWSYDIDGEIPTCPDLYSDVDNSGFVGVMDLADILSEYTYTGSDLTADLTGDGIVGSGDVVYLLAFYGGNCYPTTVSINASESNPFTITFTNQEGCIVEETFEVECNN